MSSVRRAIGIAAALLIAGAAFAASPQARAAKPAATFRYAVDTSWPKPLPHNWIIGQVGGVAVDAEDHVWILHRPRSLTIEEIGATLHPPRSICCTPAPPVIEFDRDGNVLQAWGGPKPGAPYQWPQNEHGLYIDNRGFLYINGNGPVDGQVLKFKPDGTFVKQFGSAGPPTGSKDTTRFGRPAQVRVDPLNNELYVADGYHNHRLIVLDADTGAFHRMWGAYGHAPSDPPDCDPTVGSGSNARGPTQHQLAHCVMYDPSAPPDPQFQTPVDCVWVSQDGIVYVCDRANDRLQLFRKDGRYLRESFYARQTRGRGSVWDLYFWPKQTEQYIFMPDGENDQVRVYRRADGAQIGVFGRGGHQAGDFEWVHKIALDSYGNVYAGEVGPGHRVQKFRPVEMPSDVKASVSDMLGIALALPPADANPLLREQSARGAAMAIADINAAGGIPRLAGAHLRLIATAPEDAPQDAVAAYDASVSPETGRTAGAYRGRNVPMLSAITDLTPGAEEVEIAYLRDLRTGGNAHRAAILYVDNTFGAGRRPAIERIAAGAGIPIAASIPYPEVIDDPATYAARIAESGADVVFAVSFVTDPRKKPVPSLMLILQQLAKSAKRPLVVGDGAGFTWPELHAVIGEAADGIVTPSAWNADSGPASSAALDARYRRRFGTFMPEYAGEAYAAMLSIARALGGVRRAGDAPAVRAALERQPSIARPVMVRWQRGVPVTIFPTAPGTTHR